MYVPPRKTMIEIPEIKQRLTIPEVWNMLGLPGEPGRCVPSCLREDRHASLSIYDEGRRWKDHATAAGGDVVDFIAAALQCSTAEAIRWARERLGGMPAEKRRPAVRVPIGRMDGRTDGIPRPLPPLRMARPGELEALAELRGFRVPVLAAAEAAGLLRFIPEERTWGAPSWAVTCPALRVVEARRLDGQPYPERRWTDPASGKPRLLPERKCHAWAVTAQAKAWPVNLEAAAKCRAIAFCEGGPDLIAAWHLIASEGAAGVGVVTMLGAANRRLAPESLPYFRGKRVRLFPHADPAGHEAVRQWTCTLREAGADVDAFSLARMERHDGPLGKDLNDLLKAGPDSWDYFPEFRAVMP
jgi:hypothetical protein